MKGVEKKLGLDPVEKKPKNKNQENDNIEFNEFHQDDIKDDYVDSRKSLKKAIKQAGEMSDKIIDSLQTDDVGLDELEAIDRALSRKAEAFARIIKCISDLNKDLMEIHTKYIELNFDEEEEEENVKSNSKSFSDVKKNIKQDLKLFNN